MLKKWLLHPELLDFISKSKWTATGNIITSATGLIVTIILTHLLSVNEFGQYKFVLTILGFISLTSLPGINNAILRYAAKKHDEAFIHGSIVKFLFSLGGSLIITLIGIYMIARNDPTWPIYFVAAVLFPFIYSFDGIIFFLYGRNEFEKAAFVKSLLNITPSICIVVAALFIKNIVLLLTIYLSAQAISYILVSASHWKNRKIMIPPEFFKFGKHLSIISVLSTGFSYIDKLLMTYFFGYAAVGLYATAEIIPSQFRTQSKIVFAWMLPKFVSKSRLKFSSLIPYIAMSLIVSILVCFLIAFLISPLIKLFFAKDYFASVKMARLLMISCIFWVPSLIVLAFLESQNHLKSLYSYQIIQPILGTLLYLLFLSKFGQYGLGYAIIVLQALSFAFLVFLGWKTQLIFLHHRFKTI